MKYMTLTIDNNVAYVTFDQPDSKANILSTPMMVELKQVLIDLKDKESLRAIVFQSAKPDIFIAGASIEEIKDFTQSQEAKVKANDGQVIMDLIEDLVPPTIAVINGAALGGGCELALACDYRLAVANGKVKIGLPEVNLGFVPGFGGTWRLPKVVGLSQGLEMILTCKMVDEVRGYKMGIFDHVIQPAAVMRDVKKFIGTATSGAIPPRKKQKIRTRGIVGFLEGNPIGRNIIFQQARKNVMKKTKGFYPAPLRAIKVIQSHCSGYHRIKAMDVESTAFGDLAVGLISKNLVHCFYLTEMCRKLSVSGAEDMKLKPVTRCGVLGAGIMGGGIAQLLSHRGIRVRLKDINWDAIVQGLHAAAKVFQGAMKRRKIKAHDMNVMMARISGTTDYSGFDHVDLVIEAVVEKMDIKKQVFAQVAQMVRSDTVIASNTSSLSVTEMARDIVHPERVVGFHFFNPVHRMPLIEIIQAEKTSPETLVNAIALAKRLGKLPILVQDAPGFLVNRILLAYINEAGRLFEEGYRIEEIDQVMTDFGMPMGPFTLADEVGLDVGVKVLCILEEGLGARFKPVNVFHQIVDQGLLGKKSGKGFYIHGRTRTVNPKLNSIVNHAVGTKSIDKEEAVSRMISIMVNEAAACLDEGVVKDAQTVDAGMILGTGFPPFQGGLLKYADNKGIDVLLKEMDQLEHRFADGRFHPNRYILKLKENNQSFYSS